MCFSPSVHLVADANDVVARSMALFVSFRRCTPAIPISHVNCRYNLRDMGTFGNQTYANHSGPTATFHSNTSRAIYNNDSPGCLAVAMELAFEQTDQVGDHL